MVAVKLSELAGLASLHNGISRLSVSISVALHPSFKNIPPVTGETYPFSKTFTFWYASRQPDVSDT